MYRKAEPGRGLVFEMFAAARSRVCPGRVERLSRQEGLELAIQLSCRDLARGHLTPDESRVMSLAVWSRETVRRVKYRTANGSERMLTSKLCKFGNYKHLFSDGAEMTLTSGEFFFQPRLDLHPL